MRSLFGSLTAKLLIFLTVLIGALGSFYLILTLAATKAHLEVVDQSLNREVARSILDQHLKTTIFDADIDLGGEVFTTLMQVNPNAEIYLLDGLGLIVSHAAPPDKVKLKSVAVEPINAFVAKAQPLPIYGDDPRDPKNRKVFSAAEISRSGRTVGYLYVVLGGEAYGSAATMFNESYILRLSSGLVAGSVIVAMLLGALSFYRLTTPLRRLTQTVSAFNPENPVVNLGAAPAIQGNDEVGQLALSFDQMARRIADQVQMLKAADNARREFMVYISHDLKTPIASIQGYLETLMMKWEEMEQDRRETYLSSALKANDRICMMVDGIFDLAKLEGPEAPLQLESFSVTELIQDICQKLQFEAEKANVSLAVDWKDPNVYLTGDIRLIERALANLIENAIKFSTAEGVVEIKVFKASETVSIAISNQGDVLKDEEIAKIFLPFYRGKNAVRTIKGSGVGLPIAKRVAELHDGSIHVSSSTAAGTVFTIVFPS